MFDHFPNFADVFDKLQTEPNRLHAALVHAPIMLAILGFILVLGVAITGSRSSGLRWTTVFIFMLATLAALWTVQTGEDAEHALRVQPTGVAHDVLENHEHLAKPFWISMAVTGVLVLFSSLRVTWFRAICIVLAILTSAASVIWVGAIAHWGGELVYVHQVGTGPDALKPPGTPHEDPHKDGAQKDAPPKDDAKDAPKKDATKDGAAKDDAPDKDNAKDADALKDAVKDAVKDAAKDKGEERPELKNPPEVKDKSTLFP